MKPEQKASRTFLSPCGLRLNLQVYTGSSEYPKGHVWAALYHGKHRVPLVTAVMKVGTDLCQRDTNAGLPERRVRLGRAWFECGEALDQVCAWLAKQGVEVAAA